MSAGEDAIKGLREALEVSPNNVPLRVHLAQTFLGLGRFDEAEGELREALALDPSNVDIKLALADVYDRQDKRGQAMVVVENICQHGDAPARAYVVYAKLPVARRQNQRCRCAV